MNKTGFGQVIETIKKLIVLNGIFLILMSLYRSFFFVYFANFAELKGLYTYVLKAFLLGARYDLAIIAYINSLVTVTLLLVWGLKSTTAFNIWKTALKYYYTLMYSLIFLVLATDFGFYLYFKNHINILIFGILEDDTKALFSSIYQNYPVVKVSVGFAAFIAFINWIIRKTVDSIKSIALDTAVYGLPVRVIFVFCLLAGNFMAVRGSFRLFPLGVMDAAISSNDFINKLSLTGVHTLQEALEARAKEGRQADFVKNMGYENNIEQAFADLLDVDKLKINKKEPEKSLVRKTEENKTAEKIRPNVVVLMCESFGTDLSKYNSKDFNVLGELKRHFDEDYLFLKFLSGDIGTIGSLETLLYDVPKRPESKAISQSKYGYDIQPSGAAFPFKRAGYETIVMYGGNANWRNMQSVIKNLGFDTIEGEGAMDPSYPRNQWGVYDGYLLEHIYKKLNNNDGKPKFICVMTTSNHPPYSLPPGYKTLPLNVPENLNKRITGNRNLAMQRFATYQYANEMLGEFVTKIKQSELGKNTIIAITGDHNFWDVFDYTSKDALDHFSVPLYLYIPAGLKPKDFDPGTPGSHKDIMPTLYNLSLSGAQYVSIGNDMFNKQASHVGFNSVNMIISKEGAVMYGGPNTSYYEWDTNDNRMLNAKQEQPYHKDMIKHYKAALAATDYLIKHPSGARQ
jgi:phosphoglycerol transferase MdoB-like AlkP superfamily enzyme